VLALALPCAVHAGPEWQAERTDPTIYGAAEDSIQQGEAEALLVSRINTAREAQGAAALALDATASELARIRAGEIAAAGIASHYDEAGHKCEQRFNMLGRTDHASENLVLYEIDAEVHLTPQLVTRMFEHWLAEPGHRANMLDPAHTAMGAGFVIDPDEDGSATVVGAATVFVNDYGDCDKLPPSVLSGSRLWLTGYINPGAAALVGVTLAREDLGDVREPDDPLHYSMPEPAIVYLPDGASFPAQGGRPYRITAVDFSPQTGYFSVELYFPRHWIDCRIYVSVLAERPGCGVFPVMTQVTEPQSESGPANGPGQL